MITDERKQELDQMAIPTPSEAAGLTNEELLYIYDQQQFYDDAITPELIRRAGLEKEKAALDARMQQGSNEDPDELMRRACRVLQGQD